MRQEVSAGRTGPELIETASGNPEMISVLYEGRGWARQRPREGSFAFVETFRRIFLFTITAHPETPWPDVCTVGSLSGVR